MALATDLDPNIFIIRAFIPHQLDYGLIANLLACLLKLASMLAHFCTSNFTSVYKYKKYRANAI
jgi:hypothetical protein